MDAVSTTAISFGVILLLASWLYLITVSFKEDFTWGLTSIFLPFLAYIFAIANWQKGKDPVYMAVIGWGLVIVGMI